MSIITARTRMQNECNRCRCGEDTHTSWNATHSHASPPRVFHMYSDRTVYSSVRFIRLSCARRPAHILLIYAYAEPLTHSHAARGLIGSHHCVVPARTFLISHLTTFNYIERRRQVNAALSSVVFAVRCSVLWWR